MKKQIQDAVVYVLSQILERTPEDILNDEAPYAAYHWDDGFLEILGEDLDWASGEFVAQDADMEYLFWARGDFDGTRSIVYDESIDPGVVEDEPLLSFVKKYNGHLYLPQFGQLVRDGHIEVDYPMFFGKIKSGPSLVEVATHLFVLHQPVTPLDEEFYEIDEDWVDMLNKIEDKTLREHIGVFFQDINTARCFGAYFDGPDDDSWEDFKDIEPIACWSSGEGQGQFCIARVLNTTIDPVPTLNSTDD